MKIQTCPVRPLSPCLRMIAHPRLLGILLLVLPFLACGGESEVDQSASEAATAAEASREEATPRSETRESTGAVDAATPGRARPPGEEWLDQVGSPSLEEAFEIVAQGIRFEPYRGVLRGPGMTALAGSGNSFDQSLLLAELLRRGGYRTRFVRGTLEEENLRVLIRGMYRAENAEVELGEEYEPYDPFSDPGLIEAVRTHIWVEVDQGPGSDWLPLDPSFPRGEIGAAYASGSRPFDEFPEEDFQQIRLTYWEQLRGEAPRTLGMVEGRVTELGLRPLLLDAQSIPLTRANTAPGGSQPMGGIAGALTGGGAEPAPDADPAERAGLSLRRHLFAGGAATSIETTSLLEDHLAGAIEREWLEFELTMPGADPVLVERTLFDVDRGPTFPASSRQYSVSIIPGPIPAAWFAEEQARWRDQFGAIGILERIQEAMGREAGPDAEELVGDLSREAIATGAASGHLMGLAFAAESDSLARSAADPWGVSLSWSQPRIFITSLESSEEEGNSVRARVSLDLRLDDIEAYPYPGTPAALSLLFLEGRGIMDSALEGEVVARATGIPSPVTTASLMAFNDPDSNPLQILPAGLPETVSGIEGLPEACSDMIRDALSQGRQVVIPSRPIEFGGAPRWGWWEQDPESGAMIGVLEDGEHQAAVSYSLDLKEMGLNEENGMALGMILGASGTAYFVSMQMLEYGEVTPQMIENVKKWVESVACRGCPFKASAEATSTAKVSFMGDCFKKTFGGSGVKLEAKMAFCDKYQEGFKCAGGVILAALKGSVGGIANTWTSVGLEGSVKAEFPCGKAGVEVKINEKGVDVEKHEDIPGPGDGPPGLRLRISNSGGA